MKKVISFALIFFSIYAAHFFVKTPRYPFIDESNYINLGYHLYKDFTFGTGQVDGKASPGYFFAPLYPAFIALALTFDAGLERYITCAISHSDKNAHELCEVKDYTHFVYLQYALAAITLCFVWLSAHTLTRSAPIAWLSTLIALASGWYSYMPHYFLTENFSMLFFAGFTYFLLLAWQQKKCKPAFYAGIFLAFAALSRPSYTYAFYILIGAFPILLYCLKDTAQKKPLLLSGGTLILTCFLILHVWLIRNWVQFGDYKLTKGYAEMILPQRLAYNDMALKEFGAAFIYWLPDFGDSLSEKLFPPSFYERLNLENPEGIYLHSIYKDTPHLRQEAQKAGMEPVMYMIKHELLSHLPTHIATTLPLTWRGMFVAKYWSFFVLFLFFPALFYALRNRWDAMLVFCFFPWFMLGFHAFVSINIPRYSLSLIPCLAIGAAWALHELFLYRSWKGWDHTLLEAPPEL